MGDGLFVGRAFRRRARENAQVRRSENLAVINPLFDEGHFLVARGARRVRKSIADRAATEFKAAQERVAFQFEQKCSVGVRWKGDVSKFVDPVVRAKLAAKVKSLGG